MDWNWLRTFLENFGTGFLGGAAAVLASAKFLGSWWLESQKARYSHELEEFRDRLQERQRHIQAELDRSVFVTRAHFETEFNAMKEVFTKLAEVRLRIQGLRPFFDIAPEDDTTDAKLGRLAERLQPFIAAYNENAQPFAWKKKKVHQRRFKGRRITQL